MKQYTGKTNTGKAFRGIYTTSGIPNQKQKRVRKMDKQEQMEAIWNGATTNFSINMMGILGAIVSVVSAPLSTGWKIGMAAMFLISSIHVEVEDND